MENKSTREANHQNAIFRVSLLLHKRDPPAYASRTLRECMYVCPADSKHIRRDTEVPKTLTSPETQLK